MDDDESLSTLLAMGFPDIGEIKRALRLAKNDLNEAVSILTHEQSGEIGPAPFQPACDEDVDMKEAASSSQEGEADGFPLANLYELESRVFQDNWSIPYKRDESLGRCLVAVTKMAKDGTLSADENCLKFLDRVLPEAFRKLLTSNATQRWQVEIQEGIYDMIELFLDLVIAKLKMSDEVPIGLLQILATAFDMKNDWNHKNRDRTSRGRWHSGNGGDTVISGVDGDFAQSPKDGFSRTNYGWLCDLINQFGDSGGFQLIADCFETRELDARQMSTLLAPIANCVEMLVKERVNTHLSKCMETAFKFTSKLDVADIRGKEVTAVSDLLTSLKVLCMQFWPQYVEECDRLRLGIICKMLKAPQFNSKMNALKEVSRLIEECKQKGKQNISMDQVVEWMADNRVLTVALEGNIDQIQYTDRIKAIVEFLGPRLSKEELSKMWRLQESANAHVVENIYAIMAGSACKFSLLQFEHLTNLIRETWEKSNDRVREKLLVLIGQIGKEATQVKSTQAILQLLWEVSHMSKLPKHLMEKALSEHLSILTEITFNKDVTKRTYVLKCVDDVKQVSSNIVPSIKHLHDICKSYSKGTSIYQKADKATLGELNKQHEIVKLLSMSMKSCHAQAVSVAESAGLTLQKETLFDERYTHAEVIDVHLSLMQFFLKEGDLYLSWSRCKELWSTLVDNPKTIPDDKDKIFNWFNVCVVDLEPSTQVEFFQSKLLVLNPCEITENGFQCFKTFFESVNISKGNLKKSITPPLIVERRELTGLDYLWRIVTDASSESIANKAIDYLLNMSFLFINAKLKEDCIKLHKEFITNCYSRLETILSKPVDGENAVHDGHEIETSLISERSASQALMAITISNVSTLPVNIRGQRLQQTTRILNLAERYISTIEELHPLNRTILPHAATFQGRRLDIKILTDNKKDEFTIQSHMNELIGDVKAKISESLKQSLDRLNIHCGELELNSSKDRCLVGMIGPGDYQTWMVKMTKHVTTSSSTALVLFHDDKDSATAGSSSDRSSPNSGDETSRRSQQEEEERGLPGVVMASGGQVFNMLYQLASLSDSKIIQGVRRLIYLIPTDPMIEEALDAFVYNSVVSNPLAADASPKMSPRNKKVDYTLSNHGDGQERTLILFDSSTEGMNPFRVLYNLEVLSGRLMPTRSSSYFANTAQEFSTNFLNAGGLKLILNVMQKNSMPADVDYDIRQSAYLVALQLADHLLCGQTPIPSLKPVTSPMIKPTPPKRSALDSSLSVTKSPIVISATKIVQTMPEAEFTETISCLVRVVWAAAAGNLQLACAGMQTMRHGDHPRFYLGRRSRDSSTGSSSSEGSSVSEPMTLHAGVCAQQTAVSSGDCQIAGEAFDLLVTCLHRRSNHIASFYNLPLINEFIIDTVLGSPSEEVRQRACDQLMRLSRIKITARCLNLDNDAANHVFPRQFLAKLLLKTPVPLWMPSCKARGISHSILSQCTEYFELRCSLLRKLSKKEQDVLEVSALNMVEDEMTFLHNFAPCHRRVDCTLLAGHLRLVEALLTCDGVDKKMCGKKLIEEVLTSFLFPASQLMTEGSLSNCGIDIAKDVNPKCDTTQSRVAAYSLLVELSRDCADNVALIALELIRMHHSFNENLLKEFEYSPAVERRGESNFVGLKNAGATCYMNSVLQQLYCVPGVSDQVLAANFESADEETIFYQLQNVFGHLQESKLQYYEPEKFWNCFRLFGQPVNVREQQDAFEFFTQIVDQADEFLAKSQKQKIFSGKFEGVFSDQKICQGCPHRYEREETFMALNLTVKSNNLQESLDQFVKGELLEGDNAYYCEKCKAKRNAIKRMCIRTLPSTLIIQLKRFHYDWETNRALKFDDFFQFPWTLDMSPYTSDGIQIKEEGRKSLKIEPVSNRYELVGVVVHSGQANAGHYYSYIKERRSKNQGAKQGNKWFKFNDTTVEEYNMNDETLSTECFGGMYKVKKDSGSSSLPENRQRYWNAYMLVYESMGSSSSSTGSASKASMKKTQSQSQNRFSSRKPSGPSRTSEPPAARESLSQLSDLLEKGEKKGLFASRMPAAIERGIQEENLRFLENRDVFCDEYYQFIYEFLTVNVRSTNSKTEKFSSICKESVKLGIHFLCNSYFHLRHRQNVVMRDIVDAISSLMERDAETTDWVLQFLSSEGLHYLKPFLLECPFREVRANFAAILHDSFKSFEKHNGDTEIDHINRIMSTLVGLIENDVPNNCKTSSQFFWLLSKFAQMGVKQSQQLFQLNVFSQIIKFLLGVDADPGEEFDVKKHRRRWSSLLSKEFGDLHSALAYLILACNMESQRDCDISGSPPAPFLPLSYESLCPIPATVTQILHGPIASIFVRETVCACREVATNVDAVMGMLVQVSYATTRFTKILMEEVMQQYNSANSGELKNLSTLLLELLTLEDSLQNERIKFAIDGDPPLNIDGLLHIVKNSQSSDSCRAYQCIKTLVNASNKSAVVKDYLLQNSDRWQWSVNWLKSKMTDNFGQQWSPSSNSDHGTFSSASNSSNTILSNEDSSTRTFHRTTSAQVTLEEANAILAEFGGCELLAPVEINMETEEGKGEDGDDDMPDLHAVQSSD